jgi:multidrug efflux pump subunit AcrB
MALHRSDDEIVRTTHNTARFFTENRHISWVLLLATVCWGVYGYFSMPQRKDPDIPVRVAAALCPWPGSSAERVEQLVTRQLEERIAENALVDRIDSTTRTGIAMVFITLNQAADPGREFDDINLKLNAIGSLPNGAGPITFIKDFGDTATLMLTLASPRISAVDLDLRAQTLAHAIETVRTGRSAGEGAPVTIIYAFPQSVSPRAVRRPFEAFVAFATEQGALAGTQVIEGPGFVGVDARSTRTDDELRAVGDEFIRTRLRASEFHPDTWPPIVIRDPAKTRSILTPVAGDTYSYRELKDFADLIKRSLLTLSQVSKVSLSGVLDERVYLEYSQERLASYGVQPTALQQVLAARNITLPGGVLEVEGKNLTVDPSGEFKTEREIGDVLLPTSSGTPIYLRDLAATSRAYVSPPRFLNFFTHPVSEGRWDRSRAITIAVQMRAGEQIGQFAVAVNRMLGLLQHQLPEDLIVARTSDQPLQVEENVELFMTSLYEAIVLVVLVSLVGFWEWRSALLMALSIPITLAMTFGLMDTLGIDLQQISIASLIIALGLLVDDPVVAGDAVKRDLAGGNPPVVAAWLGPTKLAAAILFATITNIVAYLPFLLLTGDTGRFLYSLPIVIVCSLVASRIVSMTFIPLLGYYLLRPKAEPSIEERRKSGFGGWYYRVGHFAIQHRWAVIAASLIFLALGGFFGSRLKSQFFPKDLQYLSYVDIWLPEDAPLSSTLETAGRVERVIGEVTVEYGREHPGADGQPRRVLESLTTFVGGGGPRFWFSAAPEQQQLNYAEVIVQVRDKHDTGHLIGPIQRALSARVPGARIDLRELETGPPVGVPVAIRVSGEDISTLRRLAAELTAVFRAIPTADRVRDSWGSDSFAVRLAIDADRANLAGVTNQDVAAASAAGLNGFTVATLREGDEQIPVMARLRMEERARLSDIQSLYVYSSQGRQKVPLGLVSSISYGTQTEKIVRRKQFRTVTVSAFPVENVLPSEVLNAAMPQVRAFEKRLPPGYIVEIGGEYEEQTKGFRNLAIVMGISVAMIFLALVIQFRHAIKPFIVFAAIPYGMVGALFALWATGSPFGFMAFLGVASLIGVIVSHVIVLFDFIEERREHGDSLHDALLGAGIMRLRPVLITVGATVIALFPLAAHGGPLWEPMCYAQIGGLTAATFITLILVPVIYSIFVFDLKLVRWHAESHRG